MEHVGLTQDIDGGLLDDRRQRRAQHAARRVNVDPQRVAQGRSHRLRAGALLVRRMARPKIAVGPEIDRGIGSTRGNQRRGRGTGAARRLVIDPQRGLLPWRQVEYGDGQRVA